MLNQNLLTSVGLLILRVSIGCMMLTHGYPKLVGFSEMSQGFADPIGLGPQFSLILAIAAEVVCSILLIVGLGTRFAAIPLAITMAVALFLVHGQDEWLVQEKAALYLAVYVTLIFTGGGLFSADRFLPSKKGKNVDPVVS